MKNYKVVKQSGPICKYTDTETGEIISFSGKDLESLCKERPEIEEAMYRDTCDAYIMKYQHEEKQEIDPDIEIEMKMKTFAEDLDFENAIKCRDKIKRIEKELEKDGTK